MDKIQKVSLKDREFDNVIIKIHEEQIRTFNRKINNGEKPS